MSALALAGAAALASDTQPTDFTAPEKTLPDSGNYIDISLGHLNPEGNEAAQLAQRAIKKHAYGGIEHFQYSGYIGKYTEFKIDGRAMHDNNDYRLNMEFLNEELGFLKFNYTEYRIWSDGSGSYFPGGNTFIELYDDELALDRTKFQIAGGLTLADMPEFTFAYTRLEREGLKDSTIRADTGLTGGFGTRNIVPTFWDIDESRDIFELGAKETFGETKATFALRIEDGNTNNARKITRSPNESRFRRITHREEFDSDLLSARVTTITDLSEKTQLTTGIAYTEIDVNASGDRIFGAEFDAPFDVDFRAQQRDHGWTDLMAESQIDQWIVNANLVTRPSEKLKTVYSLRVEELNTDIRSTFVETEFSTSTLRHETHDIELNADRDWNDIALKAEAIYTGQENVVYNGALLYTTGDGDYLEEEFDAESSEQLLERLSNQERDVIKLELGAKFYLQPGLRLFVQYYHKEKENKYNNIIDPTEPDGGDRFPAFTEGQDFTTDDINVSLRWKASKQVSGLTRIDYQQSDIESRGQGLEWAHGYDRKAIILSQAVTVAFDKFFIQGNVVYADDQRESPVSTIGGGVANTVVVLDSDFWNANLSANIPINDESSCSFNVFYNRSDNYVDNSAFAQPYGNDITEQGASASYTRKIGERAQVTLRYAYFDGADLAFGGRNDYHANVMYSSLRYRF